MTLLFTRVIGEVKMAKGLKGKWARTSEWMSEK